MNRDDLIARAKAKGMDDAKAAEVVDAYMASKGGVKPKPAAKTTPKREPPPPKKQVDTFTFEDEFISAPRTGASVRDFVTRTPAAPPKTMGPPPGVAATLSPADLRKDDRKAIDEGEAVGKQALRDALKAKVKDNPAAAKLVDEMTDEQVMERMKRF